MASPLRVLIVEDEPMISMYLEEIVEETVPAIVTIKSSVKTTRQVIAEPFHLALLDVDVTDGKTYEIAKTLDDRRIPFVFISGALNQHFPDELLDAPFIKKPFTELQIKAAVLAADRRRSSSHHCPALTAASGDIAGAMESAMGAREQRVLSVPLRFAQAHSDREVK
jgi:DNA-binding response OmpR family regulator